MLYNIRGFKKVYSTNGEELRRDNEALTDMLHSAFILQRPTKRSTYTMCLVDNQVVVFWYDPMHPRGIELNIMAIAEEPSQLVIKGLTKIAGSPTERVALPNTTLDSLF